MTAAAIVGNYKDAGLDVSLHHGVSRAVLEELTRDDTPAPARALPLDLDCYLAIRQLANEQRWAPGGRTKRTPNARRPGAIDLAMTDLMRDARLGVSEAAT